MGRHARRRALVKRFEASGESPSLPPSVTMPLPPPTRIKPVHVVMVLTTVLILAAAGYLGYRKFAVVDGDDVVEEQLQEVVIEASPEAEPEPEPETEPEPEADPEADLPDLLAEQDGASGPGDAVALDLALGTGSDGMAIAGASAAGGGRTARAAYEPGQVDKNPEPAQSPAPPEMPRQAMEQGVSGTFVATFIVNTSGRVESIMITGSPNGYGFEEAIRASLLKRRYKPAMAGGVPVPVKIRQPFDFRLE